MGISVDNFALDFRFYFLTHAHTDHTEGLEVVRRRTVYASPDTCRAVEIKFPHADTRELQFHREYDFGDFTVQLIPCDHCVGSSAFLFRFRGETHLFTGDFRYTDEWWFREMEPLELRGAVVYLDNTYEHVESLPTWAETVQDLKAHRVIQDPHLNTAPLWPALGGVWVDPRLRSHPFYRGSAPKKRAKVFITPDTGVRVTSNWFVCQREYASTEDRVCFSTHSDATEMNQFLERLKPSRVVRCSTPTAIQCPRLEPRDPAGSPAAGGRAAGSGRAAAGGSQRPDGRAPRAAPRRAE
jgi:hypothetical protein